MVDSAPRLYPSCIGNTILPGLLRTRCGDYAPRCRPQHECLAFCSQGTGSSARPPLNDVSHGAASRQQSLSRKGEFPYRPAF